MKLFGYGQIDFKYLTPLVRSMLNSNLISTSEKSFSCNRQCFIIPPYELFASILRLLPNCSEGRKITSFFCLLRKTGARKPTTCLLAFRALETVFFYFFGGAQQAACVGFLD